MNKFIQAVLAIVVIGVPVLAQETPRNAFPPAYNNQLLRRSLVPAFLLAGSMASWGYRKDFRAFRNRHLPGFRYHFDDYLQYAPAALVFSLKTAGVRGKYNTKRTVVCYVFSSLIMAGLTNTLKYTSRVERPDRSAWNSFPSGHTANAFMNASFLDHEYGDRCLVYGMFGYSMATVTAMGRLLNNRHWTPDILAGAAIGILSAELGNYLAGKICKEDGTWNKQLPFVDKVNLSLQVQSIDTQQPLNFHMLSWGVSFCTSF